MPKEFEGGKFVENSSNIMVIPKQDVEFSAPPSPKTEEAKTSKREEMIAFIHKEGFGMVMNDIEQHCLLVEDGLGIGMFHSLEEIYQYVKKGHPAADVQMYKSFLAANGYPQDFHKLPPEVWSNWDKLPEEVKQIIRENGADIYVRKTEEIKTGERVIHPNPRFKSKPQEKEKSKEEQKREIEKCIKYIHGLGFKIGKFGDGEIGIALDAKNVFGPFASLEDAYRYLKEGYHLKDIESLKKIDGSTVH